MMPSQAQNSGMALHLAEDLREEENSNLLPQAENSLATSGVVANEVNLNDHRRTLSVPRTAGSSSRSRRSTAASQRVVRPIVPEISVHALDGGIIARDFEHAIADDNASVSSGGGSVRNPSATTANGRRNTNRRNRRNRSRASSTSRASSPSPPTSVHAFSGQRRRDRSNTANTIDRPTVENVPMRAADSVEALPRRRLTFSEGSVTGDNNDDSSSTDSSVENDVCYPQSDVGEDEMEIDFEELEEFVAEAEAPDAQLPGAAAVTPATFAQENLNLMPPLGLPSPMIKPQDEDAFDELEKVKNLASRRLSVAEVENTPRPFFTFFSTESEDIIHAKSLGGLLADDQTFKDLFAVNSDDGTWWLDVVRPTEDEVSVLCKAFGVHPLTREDITTEESREKVELFRNYYFVAFRSFESDKTKKEEYLEPIHVYAVVFRQGILTFSHTSNPHASNVLRRIGKLRDHMSISSDWICYAIIDDIVDCFMPAIHDAETEVDTIEDNVYTTRSEDARHVLSGIGECRKKVITLLRLLGGKSDVIKGFAKRCNEHFSIAPTGDVGLYLSDIQDHIVTMRDNLSHSEQLLSRVHTNFLAQINVDNIEGGNKTNRMLGKVTLLATILVPMNLVTGLFGMNVKIPGRETDSLAWFGGIIAFLFAFSLLCLFVFKRMRLF
jgi:magnesium transporter